MSDWIDSSCLHKTLLASADGVEFIIIFCKYCNKTNFAHHRKESKVVFDPNTFLSSDKYKCNIICSLCKRHVHTFPHGLEAYVLDLVSHENKTHSRTKSEEKNIDSQSSKPVQVKDSFNPLTYTTNALDPLAEILSCLEK